MSVDVERSKLEAEAEELNEIIANVVVVVLLLLLLLLLLFIFYL